MPSSPKPPGSPTPVFGNDYISEAYNAITRNAGAAYDFALQFKIDNTASPLGSSTDRNALKNGDYAFWSGGAADGGGHCSSSTFFGVLMVRHFGTGAGIQMWIPSPIAGPEPWISNKFSGGSAQFLTVYAASPRWDTCSDPLPPAPSKPLDSP